ncbi:S1/P1 nuclease [Sphingomonas sp.]|uniref:S1/P1 nuclease n=1 Tax=Sphingomonas sp. TaxID=28214 RepID=UPI001DC04665|nr:S1/P1 nuclease [Sphingomonas sp.]MBX9797662.1 S1/P1 nuclease [Sphingomonas sp.]
MIRPLLALLLLATSAPALAYGQYGHNSVAQIALKNVSAKTRARVLALVRQAAAVDTPDCATKTLNDLSVWPDCVRARYKERYDYASPWHYQTLDVCGMFDLAAACRDDNCVSAQIDRDVKLLQDRRLPVKQRAEALAFLVHFVGDLHMPLHSGSHNDQGGNAIKAAYGSYAPDRLNLHGIWDGVLAERAITEGPNLVRRYPRAEARAVAAGTTADWSHESYEIAKNFVYPSSLGEGFCARPTPTERVTLNEAAIEAAVPVQRLQIKRAGLRLARLLDQAFG